jgi:uncharacterized membrane protein YfcA
MPISSLMLAALAAALGGVINAIAGGGTLVTFPLIVALGVPPLTANITNTTALWPGALGSVWGYRRHFAPLRPLIPAYSVASLIGGAAGGWLLLATGSRRFGAIVPFLVLGATLLFMGQGLLTRWLRTRERTSRPPAFPPARLPTLFAIQLAVAVYGGYFGAGIGIMMLAALGLLGLGDIHQMNALKIWGAFLANIVAAAFFAATGAVHWPLAGAMAVGGLVGGYGGARLAQRVGPAWVRRAVVAVGTGAFLFLLWNRRGA